MGEKNTWDGIADTPEVKATVERVMSGSESGVACQGEVTCYAGLLFVKDEQERPQTHKVVIADHGHESITLISMESLQCNDEAVLVKRSGGGQSDQYEGSVTETRLGWQAEGSESKTGKIARFVANFRTVH